jgi:hypothetical protein
MSRSLADLRRDIEQAPCEGGKQALRAIIEGQPCPKVRNILAGHAMAFRCFDWFADCRARGVVFDEVAAGVTEPDEFKAAVDEVMREPGE